MQISVVWGHIQCLTVFTYTVSLYKLIMWSIRFHPGTLVRPNRIFNQNRTFLPYAIAANVLRSPIGDADRPYVSFLTSRQECMQITQLAKGLWRADEVLCCVRLSVIVTEMQNDARLK